MSLLPLVQSAGVLAVAVVGFALLFSWTAMLPALQDAPTEGRRFATAVSIGAALTVAAGVVYAAPTVLLAGDPSVFLMLPIAATWLIAAVALMLRGALSTGVARTLSYFFATVATAGAVAGILSAALSQHPSAASITPTGAFLLALGAIAGVVAWAQSDVPPRRGVREA